MPSGNRLGHSGLAGESLIAAKQKLGVGVLKNKQQLVHALEKAAGQELAEKGEIRISRLRQRGEQ